MSGRPDEDLLYFALGLAVILALLIAGLSGNPAGVLPMNMISIGARLAALERQRRGHVPDRQRLAEAGARLVAWVDATHDVDKLRAFQAEIEAARRRITTHDHQRP